MSIAFYPPSYKAGTSDLAIQISPLGLVDLSNEEMEVHGIRLSRYSLYWAHYLGHHWAYRREVGEPQFTFNYVRALSDYLTNFTFGRGVTFQSPPPAVGAKVVIQSIEGLTLEVRVYTSVSEAEAGGAARSV